MLYTCIIIYCVCDRVQYILDTQQEVILSIHLGCGGHDERISASVYTAPAMQTAKFS